MKTKVYDIKGVEKGFIELDDSVFNVEVSDGAIYYAINNELANRRVGTACTKTRAEVNYSNVKPFKQKGTGNARQGDKKSPVRVGGGTIFGPRPRDYSFVLPKKMKRCAIKSLLTASVKDNRLTVLEDFTVSGKTKEMQAIVDAFMKESKRTVVILKDDDALVRRAAGNIPYVRVLSYDKLSAKELLYARKILMMEGAAKNLSAFFGPKSEEAQ